MRKFSVSAALIGVVLGVPCGAGAAYPVYQNPNLNNQIVSNGRVVYYPNGSNVVRNGTVVPVQGQMISVNSNVAANPSRVTGALPKVGSNVTAAGRQYYQPADFDRLADSGLYIGLSVGYSAAVTGSISADYADKEKAFFVPGAFKAASFDKETVMPLQISVGAAINNDIRVDFSYLRYNGLAYPDHVETSTGDGGFATTTVDGGAITANATMLNVYYNIDSYTGYLAGGSLRPYIGVGAGISLNTIADYVVSDNNYYYELTDEELPLVPDGTLSGVSDIIAYHNGGTTEQLAFMLEGGVTTELSGGLKIDFFVRYTNLGKVKTSGSIVMSQTEWLKDSTSPTMETQAQYDSVYHYTNWYESGRLSMVDVGARLRLQF